MADFDDTAVEDETGPFTVEAITSIAKWLENDVKYPIFPPDYAAIQDESGPTTVDALQTLLAQINHSVAIGEAAAAESAAQGAGAGSDPQARSLASSSSEYLSQAVAIVPGFPFTIGAWFYDTAGSLEKTIWSANNAANDTSYFRLYVNSTNHLGGISLPLAGNAVSTGTYAIGTWNHACAVFAAQNDVRIFLNGVKDVDTAGSGVGPAGLTRMAFGVYYGLSIQGYWNGGLGEGAMWNVGLSDAEVASLSTLNPWCPPALLVRPDALIGYWPMFGNGSPELDQSGYARSLTLVNTPTKTATGPPVSYPDGIEWITGS